MRILRIRLRNYRGIEDREIALAPNGVTVIEGPNEIGKSCLAEAIGLIFEHLDSTKKEAVRLTQPAHRDVGPEVEIEVETGPYHFVYSKRFIKKSETTLELKKPVHANLTGREAHARVEQILDETMDWDLWKALSVVQGDAVKQVDLATATSLAKALDRAAGQEVAGEREATIFDVAEAEYGIYFSKTGGERKPLKEAREAVEKTEEDIRRLEREEADLDDLVTRSAHLVRDIDQLITQLAESRENAARRGEDMERAQAQTEQVESLDRVSRHAAEREMRAGEDEKRRKDLVQKVTKAQADIRALLAGIEKNAPELREAKEADESARKELDDSKREKREAEELLELRRRDFDFNRDKLDLEMLGERRERTAKAQRRIREARLVIEDSRVTEKLLQRIRKTSLALDRAQAQLDAGSPCLSVTALGDVTVQIDGESRAFSRGELFERTVAARATLRVLDVIEVQVEAGTSLDELVRARDDRQAELQANLQEGRVRDLEHAEEANRERRDAERTIEEAEAAIEAELRDLDIETMGRKIDDLTDRVRSYDESRPPQPPLPADFDAAKAAKQEAQAKHDAVGKIHRAAGRKHEVVAERHRELKEEAQKADVELAVESKNLEKLQSEIQAERDHVSDNVITRAIEEARENARKAKESWEKARNDLEQEDPERIRKLAENARKVEQRADRELRKKEDERVQVAAQLELLGEKGLYDELEDIRTRLAHAEQNGSAVRQRAAAAKLLYETMCRKRDEARRGYAAPLRDKIVQLGRYIFNHSFDIELDDDLAIARRTLDGLTLPFKSLSVGTQEQLDLIVRLACSLLVDEKEGVPLIFDDTLGHTDPYRLEGMGAVLSHVGERCQIIVLTCTPGRFAHVGDAKVISFAAEA